MLYAHGIAAALLIANGASMAAQPQYELSVVAATGSVIGGVKLDHVIGPAMNDTGRVAFIGIYTSAGGEQRAGVFSPSRMLVSSGAVLGNVILDSIGGGGLFGSSPEVSISNAGTVAFVGSYRGLNQPPGFPPVFGVFTTSTAPNSATAYLGNPPGLAYFKYPVVSSADKVVFWGAGRTGTGAGLYTSEGPVVKTGDTIDGKTITRNFGYTGTDCCRFAVAHSGKIAFSAEFEGGGVGIFVSKHLLVATGDVVAGKLLTFVHSPAIGADRVAFVGSFSGGQAIFGDAGIVVSSGDTIDGRTLTSVSYPAMNARGDIVFIGEFSGGAGIFTKREAIAVTGQVVGGKSILSVGVPRVVNSGSIVFGVTFADGTTAILTSAPRRIARWAW